MVHPKKSSVLLCTSMKVAQDGSEGAGVTCVLIVLTFFVKQCTEGKTKITVCTSCTFLLTFKTTLSMVRCVWISFRALFGPKPAILSQ